MRLEPITSRHQLVWRARTSPLSHNVTKGQIYGQCQNRGYPVVIYKQNPRHSTSRQ